MTAGPGRDRREIGSAAAGEGRQPGGRALRDMGGVSVYQIVRITDKEGVAKAGPEDRENLGCMGDAKMDEGCVLIHCRYDRRGDPCDRYIRTSYVQSWKKDKETGRIVVETVNSVYQLDPVKIN